MDGLVRGPWKRRTDHFAPLVHAPKKTISKFSQTSLRRIILKLAKSLFTEKM
jgi:hypothetical protein